MAAWQAPVFRPVTWAAVLLATALVAAAAAVEPVVEPAWPHFGGPTRDGHALPVHAAGLPLKWDEATGLNIAWRVPLVGQGYSSPVVGHGKVWFTAATEDGTEQYVYSIDAATGEVLHHELVFHNESPEPLGNPINTYASPTCVLESDAVYVHFGTYGTARLDPESCRVVWQRRDINVRHYRGPGSSPLVDGDLLVLTFDGISQQFVTALNKHTGETVWLTERSTNYNDLGANGRPIGDGDLRKAFNTPSVVEVAGRKQLVSVGAKAAYGYDLLTGLELWTVRHGNYNAAIRPLFFGDLVLLNTGSNNAHQLAVRLDSSTSGDVTDTHVQWERSRANCKLPTPVLVAGRLYMVVDNGVVYCLDPRNGEELGVARIGGTVYASPIVVGERIYISDEAGKTTVLSASPKLEVVAENELADGCRASVAVAYGALYLRTFDHLYKLAEPRGP